MPPILMARCTRRPGFSWSNLQRKHGGGGAFNQIPRNHGKFWSHQATQFAEALGTPPLFLYAAMFDEVDEGTAMFKGGASQSARRSNYHA